MGAIWRGLQELLGSAVSFFYSIVPNMGVAIILLTILVGVVLFPLTLKQTKSMKAMQEIQPEVKRLQKDLKHDRQAQQAAVMELYKEKGVNPVAGCLPLILQMPIWFALFSLLRSFAATEVIDRLKFIPDAGDLALALTRGNTDFLWMDMTETPRNAFDIGIADAIPYLITIAIVMFTAYWQQRQTMARQQSDPQAQKLPGQAIMKIFPVFFGFISFSMPAGLVVYFAASQIFRIGQQSFILRLGDDKGKSGGATPKESKKKPIGEGQAKGPEKKAAKEPTPRRETGATPKGSNSPKGPDSARRPQGSKKRRGKKRKRR